MTEFTAIQAASLYIAIFMTLGILLAYRVIQARQGDDDVVLQRRIRIHGNMIEYAPFYLLGLIALATLGASSMLIHGFGIVFTIARLGHAFNYYNKPGVTGRPKGRFFGTLFTGLSSLALAGVLLYFVFFG